MWCEINQIFGLPIVKIRNSDVRGYENFYGKQELDCWLHPQGLMSAMRNHPPSFANSHFASCVFCPKFFTVWAASGLFSKSPESAVEF